MFRIILLVSFFLTSSGHAAETQFGVFMVVKGDIKVQKGNQAPVSVKVASKVLQGETVISGADSRAKIVMNDRNVIYISPQTKLTIDKYSDGKQGAKNVELRLDQGRVLNNVQQKYDGDKEKYIIKTPTAVAGVRGTSFFTSFDVKTRITEVITQSGTVALTSLDAKGASLGTVLVNKGEGSRAGTAAPPEPPKPVPVEQMQQVEGDVAGGTNTQPPKSATTDGKKSDSTKGDVAKNPGRGFRLNDKNDTAPDTVVKTPAPGATNPTTGTTTLAPPPLPQGTRPTTGTQATDAVRSGITEKKKVKVELNGQ